MKLKVIGGLGLESLLALFLLGSCLGGCSFNSSSNVQGRQSKGVKGGVSYFFDFWSEAHDSDDAAHSDTSLGLDVEEPDAE